MLEIQQDENVRGALRLINIYLNEYVFDRYLTKEGQSLTEGKWHDIP